MSDIATEVPMGRLSVAAVWRPRDPLRWSRFRWLTIATVWAIGAVLFGGLLLFGGERVVLAKGAWAVYVDFVGAAGIRISGACVLLIGLVLIACLGLPFFGYPEPQHIMRRALRLLGYYYLWCAIEFAFAPQVPGGQISWLGLVTFPMLGSIPLVLTLKGPPELVPRAETRLIATAMDLGASREFARLLAQRLYGGSDEES